MGITETLAAALNRVIAFLPHLLAGLIILAVGLAIAAALASVTRRLLHTAGFDRFLARHDVLKDATTTGKGSRFVGKAVFWVITLVAFIAAADALRLPWVTAGLARIVAYLPRVFAAGVIVLAAWVLGNFALRVFSRQATPSARLQGRVARGAVWMFAGFMAIQELNIAVPIVTTAFALMLGAMAVAAAVAFGLGNRELAGRVTREWYERSRPGPDGMRAAEPMLSRREEPPRPPSHH